MIEEILAGGQILSQCHNFISAGTYLLTSSKNAVLSIIILPTAIAKNRVEMTRAGTNTPSDEYDSYHEYMVANTNMYSRIHFFSEAKLGNGLSVLVYACMIYNCTPLRSFILQT